MSSKFVNEIPCWSVNRLHVDTLTKSQKQKCGNEMSSFTCFFLKMKFDTWRKIFKIVTLHKGRQESGSLLCGFNIFWWQEKRARLWCWLDGRKFPFCLRNFASSFLECWYFFLSPVSSFQSFVAFWTYVLSEVRRPLRDYLAFFSFLIFKSKSVKLRSKLDKYS